MTPESVGPLSRPITVDPLPREELEHTVEATEEERDALALDFKLPAIRSLEGRFKISGSPERIRVVGRVVAKLTQTCVVSLEPFDSTLEEEVQVDFVAPDAEKPELENEHGEDPPDEIVDGQIDLGALTAEFLALGLDPYPKKPGAELGDEPKDEAPASSPFAILGKLTGKQ